jgi:hypothetical protein
LIGRLITDPGAAIRLAFGGRERLHRYVTARLLCMGGKEIDTLYSSIASNRRFLEHIKSETLSVGQYLGEIARPTDLYVICRALKPRTVIETGVASGISSAFILQALEDNSEGKLYSIDLPVFNMLPQGKETGWIVPNWLRERWELYIVGSKDLLPELLQKLDAVNVFIHDADVRDMMFEFPTIWPKLKEGGLILSDHVDLGTAHGAFYKFARAVNRTPARLYSRLGAIKK